MRSKYRLSSRFLNPYILLTGIQPYILEHNHNVLIACCREARRSENLKLARKVMAELNNSQSATSEMTPLSLRIAREAAKQVYASHEPGRALDKMISIALNPVDHENQKEMSELIARFVSYQQAN